MNESNCSYVSSRGLLKSCDITYNEPSSSTSELPNLTKMFDYCTLYVCNSAIYNLSQKINDIKYKFILVSGDADEENYKGIFKTFEEFNDFVSNDKLVHWFCQNSTVDHPKVTTMPIGLDYHSSIFHQGKTPQEQETMLIELKNQSNPFSQRELKCYINFKKPPDMYTYKSDRIEALHDIPESICFKEIENQPRDTCWQNQAKYAFVVSPFGNGLDCHRTWEALILGCIPIMKKYNDTYSNLFHDLPVLIVENWSDVTEELLKRTIQELNNKNMNLDKLTLKYWTDKINSYKHKDIQENFESNNLQSIFYESNIIKYCIIIILLVILLFIIINIKKYK